MISCTFFIFANKDTNKLKKINNHKQHKTMNKEQETMVYEAPQVRVIEVEVEKGFAASLNEVDGETDGF